MMTQADVEGIYEMHVPPIFRAISSLGCVARASRRLKRDDKHLSEGFQLEDLEMRDVIKSQDGYMANVEFSTAFFYYSSHSNGRSVMAFITEEEEEVWEAFVAVTNPFGGSVPDVNLAMVVEELKEESGGIEINIRSNVVMSSDPAESKRAMYKHLENYKGGIRGPTIVLSQSTIELLDLYRLLPPLQEDFPVVTIPYSSIDNDYPALQWYPFVAKRMISRFLVAPNFFKSSCEYARFMHCPIGNLEGDALLFATDIFFSRRLADGKSLWWVSEGPRPDLGGLEEDQNLFDEEHKNPEVIIPGMYSTVCVELNMTMLHINSILKWDEIVSLEADPRAMDDVNDGTKAEAEPRSKYTFDDASSCRESFKILRKLVLTLVQEKSSDDDENDFPGDLMQDLYRWLHSPSSYLHDPLLHRYVHHLMKKVFVQILTEMRKLSARIVYASFNKVIIDTGKTNFRNAANFVRYSIETITSSGSLFEWIDLDITKIWAHLAFLDTANYGGYEFTLKEELMESDDVNAAMDESNYTRELVMDWNIQSYLPEECKTYFETIVAGYIDQYHSKFQELYLAKEAASERATQELATEDAAFECEKYRSDLLENTISTQIFESAQEIHRALPPDSNLVDCQSAVFPMLPGSHLPLNNPALEFVKYTCRVLELDQTIQHQVSVVKRNALRLVASKEFAKDTEFQNPCLTHVLPDVVCPNCKTARDLDICRDPSWHCTECQQQFAKELVETRLVEVVIRRNMSYQVQDVKCQKCGIVKACLMSEYCECSGDWANTQPASEFVKEVRTFLSIARHYKMEWLEETTNWIIQSSGVDLYQAAEPVKSG